MSRIRNGFVLSGWLWLLTALAGYPFDPKVPSARVICANAAECPSGYTCEPVAGASQPGLAVCCKEAGCAQNLPDAAVQQLESARKDAAVEQASDTGSQVVKDGATDVPSDARADAPRDTAAEAVSDVSQQPCGNGRLDP